MARAHTCTITQRGITLDSDGWLMSGVCCLNGGKSALTFGDGCGEMWLIFSLAIPCIMAGDVV